MTVPRKVSPFISSHKYAVSFSSIQTPPHFTQSPPVLLTFPVSFPALFTRPVGPVPGRPVPRHSRARPCPGGRRVVRWQERWPHPHLAQRRLRLRKEPRSKSGQDEHPGDQGSHKSREHPDCPEARYPKALSGECVFAQNCLLLLLITRLFKQIMISLVIFQKGCTQLLNFFADIWTLPFTVIIMVGTIHRSYASAHTLVFGSQFSGAAKENVNSSRASLQMRSLLILTGLITRLF